MFRLTKPVTNPTVLDHTIEILTAQLADAEPGTKEQASIAESLKKAVEAKAVLLTADQPDFIRAEVWATLAASLGGTVLMLNHERLHVITSKVTPYVLQNLIRFKI